MCHYPDIQKQAAGEIDEFIKTNGRIPSFKERDQVPYCISVMKESMRYRPITSFGLAHTVREDSKYPSFLFFYIYTYLIY